MIDPQIVSRGEWLAPLARIEPFRRRMGWTVPWYSCFGSDFGYDFHVSLDPAVAPVEYNYRDLAELGPKRQGDRVFHTYSSYARGTDLVNATYNWLDLTARGRQEDWEQRPGPQRRSADGVAPPS
jgi:predicted dithiol-disulfide oxidoreductase (DUF899 family)